MKTKIIVAALAALAGLVIAPALAQQPPVVRGTVTRIDGATVYIKPAQGPDVAMKLLDNANVFGVKAATIGDVAQGDFIGVGAMPQPDGTQKAILVTIFAESQRGTGEGFRPWDRPNSTMTNGTVGAEVTSVNGRMFTVNYKGGEQKIVIGPDAKIRRYVPGTRADLKPGVHVAVLRPARASDGTLQTTRINVGIGDMVP